MSSTHHHYQFPTFALPKIVNLHSLGEYSVSDNFLRSQVWLQQSPNAGSNAGGGGGNDVGGSGSNVISGSDSVDSAHSGDSHGSHHHRVTFGLNSIHTRKVHIDLVFGVSYGGS